jgi:hypothetical protein
LNEGNKSVPFEIAILVGSNVEKMRFGIILILPLLTLIAYSCVNKDEQFCRCLALGEELNEASSKALAGKLNWKQAQKVRDLARRQKKECSDYHTMNGAALKDLRLDCAE